MSITRRGFLTATGLACGYPALSGCGLAQSSAAKEGEITIFSSWTGGSEQAGLRALMADFARQYPTISLANRAIGGGAGDGAKQALASRMQSGNPPDTFQAFAGAELSDYVEADQIEDLSFLYYEEEVWGVAFDDVLLRHIAQDGKIYSVPLNVHRANVLWHNVRVLDDAGLSTPPQTFEEFFTALDKVRTRGKTPLALGEPWTAQHLLETVLLGQLGANDYEDLWEPQGDWGAPKIKYALQTYANVLSFANQDTEAKTWQDTSTMLADGEAGFNVMGDWAAAYFDADLKLKPDRDYGWSATPDTDGVYQFLCNSFTLPKGAKNRDAAIAWLKTCGSKSGQNAFNPKKGSIPARFDANPKLYGAYQRWALEEWATNDNIVGSLTHGVVANTAWTTEIAAALVAFFGDKHVDKLQEALGEAAQRHAR